MISAKFFDDQYYNNAYYAKVGGVPCKEMNSLEVEFLFLTNFSLFVTYDTYKQYHTELRNHAMRNGEYNLYKVPELGEDPHRAEKEKEEKNVVMMQTDSPQIGPNQDTVMMASTPY